MKEKRALKIGSFYKAYGGQSHPSLVFFYDRNHKTYLSIKFGTTKGRHMTEIHPIQEGYDKSYVRNRPFEGTKDDYGDEELLGLRVDNRDLKIIENIKTKNPDRSRRAKKRYKKSRRAF